MSQTAVADAPDVVTKVQAASAGLSRLGDGLVTESAAYEAEPGSEERTIVVTLSTADRDRHGDILEPEGAGLANFRKNPVVLFAHRHDLPAVGKVLWVRSLPGRLVAKVAFARTGLGTELHSLYSKGYMKAWSVGFLPVEWERIPGKDSGVRVTKWELLEVSAVPVPANPEALSKAIEGGEVTEPVLVGSLGEPRTTHGGGTSGPGAVAERLAKVTKLLELQSGRLDKIAGRLDGLEAQAKARDSELDPAPEAPSTDMLEMIAQAAAGAFERRIRALKGRVT